MAALRDVDKRGYAALLLRRTYADLSLPGAIMDRAHSWLQGSDAHWNDREKTYTFPSGATLTFGYLEHEGDKYRYQGAEFQFIGFDELTQFTEAQYTYLLSRLRRLEGVQIPLRMRGAGNPGGAGHEWVKARFVGGGRATGRPFIPAKLADNPHLDQAAYRASLAGLDAVTRAQLEEGNWDVAQMGDLFSREWFRPVEEAYTVSARVRYWDMAASTGGDYTAGVRMARTTDGLFIVEDVARFRLLPGERDAHMRQIAEQDGHEVAIWLEEEGGSSGKAQTASVAAKLAGFVVSGERPTGPKDVRARPFASQLQADNVRYVPGSYVSDWVTELVSFPAGVHDDMTDASSGAFNKLAGVATAPFAWRRNDPAFVAAATIAAAPETPEQTLARRVRERGST